MSQNRSESILVELQTELASLRDKVAQQEAKISQLEAHQASPHLNKPTKATSRRKMLKHLAAAAGLVALGTSSALTGTTSVEAAPIPGAKLVGPITVKNPSSVSLVPTLLRVDNAVGDPISNIGGPRIRLAIVGTASGVDSGTDYKIGLYGHTDNAQRGTGVYGYSSGTGYMLGLYGYGDTYGALLKSAGAQLRLEPGITVGPPTTGSHEKGEFYADSDGSLHYCVAAGTPGGWRTLATLSGYRVYTEWDSLNGWLPTPAGGIIEVSPASQLHLLNQNSGITKITYSSGPFGAFTVEFRGRVANFTVNDPNTSATSLGTKVVTGTKRLMLAIQGDGVYAISGTSNDQWNKIYPTPNDINFHTWKVVVDNNDQATLYKDGGAALVSWSLQNELVETPRVEHWVTGTPGASAEAFIDWTKVSWG